MVIITPSPNTTNETYIHGDYDKDGTPNVDDKYPFNKNKSEPVQEVFLSDEIKKIKEHNDSYKDLVSLVKKKFPKRQIKYRIKGVNSTIGKLRRKHIKQIYDVAGMTIFCKNEEDISIVASQIHKMFNVTEDKNYYKDQKVGNKYYMARHLIISLKGNPVEIQLKTRAHYELHQQTHPIYKKYGKIPRSEYMKLLHTARTIRKKEK